jgi:isocitrate dehydrogenase kinase/phosphatase
MAIENNDLKLQKILLACHKTLADANLFKKDMNGANSITYCNVGVYMILNELGKQSDFWNKQLGRMMMANEMYDVLKAKYPKVDIHADFYVPKIFVASQKNIDGHGHIAVIYPSRSKVYTGKWNCYVPLVCNIGKENAVMGLNWAFGEMPEIFDLGEVS